MMKSRYRLHTSGHLDVTDSDPSVANPCKTTPRELYADSYLSLTNQ